MVNFDVQVKDDTKNTTKGNKKVPITLLNSLITILSAINTSMLAIVKLIYITSQQIGIASIMLGNISTGVFLAQCP